MTKNALQQQNMPASTAKNRGAFCGAQGCRQSASASARAKEQTSFITRHALCVCLLLLSAVLLVGVIGVSVLVRISLLALVLPALLHTTKYRCTQADTD